MGLINQAWKIQGLKPIEKFLFVALSDDADKETGTCSIHTTTRRLASDLGVSMSLVCRLVKKLRNYGLAGWSDLHPGANDGLRHYQVYMPEKPEAWEPPEGMGKRRSRIMSTCTPDFLEALLSQFPDSSKRQVAHTWLHPLQLVAVQKDRLLVRVPKKDFADAIWKDYSEIVISTAQRLISPEIKKIKFLYPPVPAKKWSNK